MAYSVIGWLIVRPLVRPGSVVYCLSPLSVGLSVEVTWVVIPETLLSFNEA